MNSKKKMSLFFSLSKTLFLFIFLSTWTRKANGLWGLKKGFGRRNRETLAMGGSPPAYEPYLVEFHGPDCQHCEDMLPLMKKVEKQQKTKFRRYMVWEGTDEFDLLRILDSRTHCHGLPFFYNRRSHKAICGATTWENFREWAAGRDCKAFAPPAPEPEEPVEGAPKKKGFMGKLKGKLNEAGKGILGSGDDDDDDDDFDDEF